MIIFVFIIMTLFWFIYSIKHRNLLHPLTFIYLGFYIPLLFYNFNWSKLIDTTKSTKFDFIIISFTFLTICFCLMTNKNVKKVNNCERIVATKVGKYMTKWLTIIWIFLYLIENYMGSGSFFPALAKIDAHKISVPIISYFTNSSFIVTSLNLLMYKATKKKKNLLYIAICLIIPVMTRSSRMATFISVIQLITLFFICFKLNKNSFSWKKIKYKYILVAIILIAFIVYMGKLTNTRMNHYGKYDLDYGETIQYTGPGFFGIMEVYYGYFPMSFNNLKINLLYNKTVKHNYIGLYSYTSFWYGLLQLDNIFGINSGAYLDGRLVSSGAATVATGFWEFWYDYGFLAFIPMIVAFAITRFILTNASKEKNKMTYRVLYAWFIPFWFFTSFQNVLFQSVNIVVFIILYNLIKKSFIIVKYDEFGNERGIK